MKTHIVGKFLFLYPTFQLQTTNSQETINKAVKLSVFLDYISTFLILLFSVVMFYISDSLLKLSPLE